MWDLFSDSGFPSTDWRTEFCPFICCGLDAFICLYDALSTVCEIITAGTQLRASLVELFNTLSSHSERGGLDGVECVTCCAFGLLLHMHESSLCARHPTDVGVKRLL